MTFPVSFLRCALLLVSGMLVLSGCERYAQSQLEEEKEPHFLAGKSRVSSMDYQGAIEAFEKALAVNPQSAAAHFELGWLFDQKESNPAAAIYHYEHYLKLRPDADKAELVKQHILACKQQLAQSISLAPVNEQVQRQFQQLTEDNKRLNEDNQRLREELEKWRGYAATLQSLTNRASSGAVAQAPLAVVSSTGVSNSSRFMASVPASGIRIHTVKAGETPIMVARQYGLRLEALMAANPRLNPRRMLVGQSLSIPPAR